jgi:hypothetical protein
MRSLFAISAVAMLVIPEATWAQSAGSMGVDVMGTGHPTLGTDTDPHHHDAERLRYDFDVDEVQTQAQRRVEGPDIRFH